MNFRFYLRQTQALCTTILLGSMVACTNVKKANDPTHPEGTAAGATTGATAGTGASAATKGKPGGGTGATTAGAAVDGATGAANGDSTAKKKESALDSQISGIQRQVASRRDYNEKLRTVVTAKEQQLNTILAADRSAGPSAQEFDLRTSVNSKLGEIDREASSWQETIDAHKAVMKKAADDPHATDLQNQINQLSEQREELLRQRAKLAALPDKLKPQ